VKISIFRFQARTSLERGPKGRPRQVTSPPRARLEAETLAQFGQHLRVFPAHRLLIFPKRKLCATRQELRLPAFSPESDSTNWLGGFQGAPLRVEAEESITCSTPAFHMCSHSFIRAWSKTGAARGSGATTFAGCRFEGEYVGRNARVGPRVLPQAFEIIATCPHATAIRSSNGVIS